MQRRRLNLHALALCVPEVRLDHRAHQRVQRQIFEQVVREVVLLSSLFLLLLCILLSDFVREADEFVRVFADFFAIIFDLLLHECDRIYGFLLLLLIFKYVKLLELLDIVVDLNHLFDKLVPSSVDFALDHVLGVVYR